MKKKKEEKKIKTKRKLACMFQFLNFYLFSFIMN